MSKVFYTQNNYTVNSTVLVNRHSNDVASRDSGLMKVRVSRGAWALKTECEAALLTDKILVDRIDSRTLDRRSKRK